MTSNCILRKRATDMHDYRKLSSDTRACKDVRNSTDCSAFKYLYRIQFRLTTPTALTTFHLSHCQSLSAGRPTMAWSLHWHQTAPALTHRADLLCHYFLLCSLHSGCTGFLQAPRRSSVCSCFRAFELAFSLPVMFFLQIYAWLTPSYPSRFCPNAIFSVMPALVLGLQSPLTCSISFHST